jgi:hypothetical protein
LPGENLAVDGKVLRGPYQLEEDNPDSPHAHDGTQAEDALRIRMHQLPQIFAVARNFALNIYRPITSQTWLKHSVGASLA